MRLLVTGATGYVGSRLVQALLDEGHDVVVASRSPKRLAQYGWADEVRAVDMDVNDADSVRAALDAASSDGQPVDAIYYLVHGIGQADFADGDRAAARNVAQAARKLGVKRIIYLGGFVPDGDEMSAHLRSRADVGEGLAIDGGAELVWLRAAVILGAGSTSFEILRYLADRFPVIPEPGWMDNPMDPISIRDVIHYLVAAADPSLPAGSYDIAGPDTGVYRSILDEYLRAIRMPRARIPLPSIPTRLAGKVGGIVTPAPASLTEELVTSLRYPMRASEHRIQEFVPAPAGGLTPMREAIRSAVGSPYPRPVSELADLHHLADTDPDWAGGDWLRARRTAVGALVGVVGTAAGVALIGRRLLGRLLT